MNHPSRTTQNEVLSPCEWKQTWESILSSQKPSQPLTELFEKGLETQLPELHNIRGVVQNPVYHPEGSVEVHTQMCADLAAQFATERGFSREATHITVLAAICHDFGKAKTTIIHGDGRITSHEHPQVGAELVEPFLTRIGMPMFYQAPVKVLVETHMRHIVVNPSRRIIGRLKRKLEAEGATLEMWAALADADVQARGEAAKPLVSPYWLKD